VKMSESKQTTLTENIKHLGLIPGFRRKVRHVFEVQKGFSKRVYWKPYGWIRFVPNADGNYTGFLESETQQQVITKWVNESIPYRFNSRKCGSCVYLTLPIRGLQKHPRCLLGLKPETCDGPFLATKERLDRLEKALSKVCDEVNREIAQMNKRRDAIARATGG